MAKDYYEILGVDRSAGESEIKKAYRKLALESHPDRNPDDPDAEAKFKKVSEAYAVLSDSQKRAMYDQLGHDGFVNRGRSGMGGAYAADPFDIFASVFGEGFGSIFDDFFGGGGRRSRTGPSRGADLRYNLQITFEEAVFGADKQFKIKKAVGCERCKGEGAEPGSSKQTCPHCRGSGFMTMSQGIFSVRQACPNCSGTGEVISNPCNKCQGRGHIQERRTIKIHIPPGVDTGNRLRVANEGEPGHRGGPPGDLFVILQVEPHEIFHREGEDILVEVPIDFPTAALGGEVRVPTIGGVAKLKIPGGTQHGAVFRMRGKGIPSVRGHGRGDQHVRVLVEVPKKLSKEQTQKLKDFAESLDKGAHPHLDAFLDKIKKLFDD